VLEWSVGKFSKKTSKSLPIDRDKPIHELSAGRILETFVSWLVRNYCREEYKLLVFIVLVLNEMVLVLVLEAI
jgi:hypothetical protein